MKNYLKLHLFQGDRQWRILSFPRTLSAWPSLLTAVPRTFSLLDSQGISTSWIIFLIQACSGKSMFRPFVNMFLIERWFSVHNTNSSVNFVLIALLSYPKFEDRPLFKSEVPSLICWHFEYPQNNYFMRLK